MKIGLYMGEREEVAERLSERIKKEGSEAVIADEFCLCKAGDISQFDAVVNHPCYRVLADGRIRSENCLPTIGSMAERNPDTEIYLIVLAKKKESESLTGIHPNLFLFDYGEEWSAFLRSPVEYIRRFGVHQP